MAKNKSGYISHLERMAILAMLVALEVVLSRFLSVYITQNLKFGFNFIPIAVAAYLYGPIASTLVGAMGDFIGAMLFPVGAYFPGFTLTAALTGLIFGLLLYRRLNPPKFFGLYPVRIVLSVIIIQCLLTIFLDSLWLSIYYPQPYAALIIQRTVKAGVMAGIQIASLVIIIPVIKKISQSLRI